MVFFTCNACGEALKKGQVEKHLDRCPNCRGLSCMDCGKDFWGEDYKGHLKCLSEDQKYGGKNYEAKRHKGDVKQQEWIQKIHETIKKTSINPKVQEVLEQMSAYDNIPRKKRKFQNWMANSLKIHDAALQDQVWDIFSEVTKKQENLENQSAENESSPAASEENGIKTEKLERKKRKKEEKGEKKNMKHSKKGKQQDQPESEKSNGGAPEEDAVQGPPGNCLKVAQLHRSGSGLESKAAGPKARGKKRKHGLPREEDEAPVPQKIMNCSETEENNSGSRGKFNWKGTIKAVLKQAPDNELSIKKLRKKVISQYYEIAGDPHKSEEEILALFNRKVSGNPKFRVLKEKVKLLK